MRPQSGPCQRDAPIRQLQSSRSVPPSMSSGAEAGSDKSTRYLGLLIRVKGQCDQYKNKFLSKSVSKRKDPFPSPSKSVESSHAGPKDLSLPKPPDHEGNACRSKAPMELPPLLTVVATVASHKPPTSSGMDQEQQTALFVQW